MYHQYFGLRESPFSISVNPRYLFMSPRHRDALAHLLYGVESGGGFILLTGEVGTGKTTINRCFLEQLPESTDLAIVLNPALSAVELLATVCDELEIDYPQDTTSLKWFTDALHRFLLENHAAGRRTVLMIDEAQHLDFDVLEQIRLLTNLETDEEKLLQIILIGQPELNEKLGRPELRQLNQRITARYTLQPLNRGETGAYIRHRLQVAGLPPGQELFSPAVVRAVHRRSLGIPRQINLLCERVLLGTYGRQQARPSRGLVTRAAQEVFGPREQPWRRHLIWLVAGLALVVASVLLYAFWWDAGDSHDAASLSEPSATGIASTTPGSPGWLLPETRARHWLWQLASDAPPPPVACPDSTLVGIRCVEADASMWDPLVTLERPVLIDMRTPQGFSAATLVLAFDGVLARVVTETGIERVPLVDLATSWRGSYRYLWQAPAGWRQPLGLGDQGPVVAEVARMFAVLDGQDQPLTGNRFGEALEARVRLFQEAQGLEADGVVGERTLMRLNDRLGVGAGTSRASARIHLLTGGS